MKSPTVSWRLVIQRLRVVRPVTEGKGTSEASAPAVSITRGGAGVGREARNAGQRGEGQAGGQCWGSHGRASGQKCSFLPESRRDGGKERPFCLTRDLLCLQEKLTAHTGWCLYGTGMRLSVCAAAGFS